jgi:hypothetical protein
MRDLLSQNYPGETVRYAECMIYQTPMVRRQRCPAFIRRGINLPAVVGCGPIARGRRDPLPPHADAVRAKSSSLRSEEPVDDLQKFARVV